jgi:STE24 endopeptidase
MAPRASLTVLSFAGAVGGAAVATTLLAPRGRRIAPVAVEVSAYFTEGEVARARRFRRPQRALGLARVGVQGVVLGVLVRRPPRRGGAAATAVGTALALDLATLPLSALARRRAIAVGLATDSWRDWLADTAKASALSAGLTAAAAATAATLRSRVGDAWWLPGSALAVAGSAALAAAAPVVLDPMFNRFTPLPAGELRDDVLALADAAGVTVGEVFVVDASRRTTAANAYVTGLGATKRVVLFDTLLDHFARDEARLVVAHELAHVRHRDVLRSLAVLALTAPLALQAIARLAEDVADADDDALVPALALAAALVAAPVGVLSARLSRRVEAAADTFALEATDAPEASVSFTRRIAVRNVIDPEPPRWLHGLLATHPSAIERIGIAEAYNNDRGSAVVAEPRVGPASGGPG